MAMIFPGLPGLPLPYRLRGIGIHHLQEPIRRPHGYPQFQWIQIRSGRLLLEAGGLRQTGRPGDGFFLRPDEPHGYWAVGGGEATVDWMGFDGPGIEASLAGGPLGRSAVYRLTSTDGVDRVFEQTWAAASGPSAAGTRLSACVYELLMVLTEAASGQGRPSAASGLGRLEPVLAALASRPAYPWDIEALAAILGVSPQHLGRLFRRALGQSPLEYLARLRMNRALQLLVERPDLRVHEVGEAVGYPDPNYFIRRFRASEGRTPGEFRDLHGSW
jgi:AraC family transcriptional regulator of arabinose operon